jgi:hypothetical protein
MSQPTHRHDVAHRGLVPVDQLGAGVADATTFLRGDQTWAAGGGGGGGMVNPMTAAGDLIVGETAGTLSDVAPSGTASASSTYGARVPALAIDLDDTTGWQATANVGEWLEVDLGAAYTISAYHLLQTETGAPNNYGASHYKLQASSDDATWTDIYDKTGATADDGTIAVPPSTARYWRVLSVAGMGGANLIVRTFSLFVGETAGTPTRLPIGADGKVLTANSYATDGVDWEYPLAGWSTSTLAGNTNDWAVVDASMSAVLVDASGDYNLTGMVAGYEGQRFTICDWGTNGKVITLLHGSASSAVGNRFALPLGASMTITDGQSIEFRYLNGAWRAIVSRRLLPNPILRIFALGG